jgi:tetratricopeptide (TPR) repeat protein
MRTEDVVGLLKQARVVEALEAADEVEDKREVAAALTEFAGALNYLRGHPDLTEVLLKKSLTLDPENPLTHYNIGVAYTNPRVLEEDESKAEKAEVAFKNALKINPGFHEARYNLALLYYFTGRVDAARDEYARITGDVGDDVRFRKLGTMLLDYDRL